MQATKTRDKLDRSELTDRIATVERRLENRRARLLEDARESAHAASDAASKVLPIAAAAGAGLLAFYLIRGRRSSARRAYRRYDDWDGAATPRRRVRWASIAGLLGTAVRIGTSPQFRAIVQNLRERRRGY